MADTINAMMAIPNLIALIVLSPVVFAITKEIFRHARQVGEQSALGLRPGCRQKPVAKAVIVPPSPACYSLAVDDD